jgi:deferrochelatase/peroxidase EfeB
MPIVVHQAQPARPADDDVHQPGIAERQQRHLRLAGVDGDRALLREWAATARELMAEHAGQRLTVTLGIGAGPLPLFPGDELDPARSDGDLGIQVCADDELVAAGTLAALVREPRWVQAGSIGEAAPTPRNLLGFKDGTLNLRRPQELDEHVWTPEGGTFLVYRRIRLDVAGWLALPVERQELIMGRRKVNGGPLGGGREYEERVLDALPDDAHVKLSAPDTNGGVSMLRRAYDFTDAPDDAGLAFICFVRDPASQYVPMQRRLADRDALNAYAVHTASALFAIPPLPVVG